MVDRRITRVIYCRMTGTIESCRDILVVPFKWEYLYKAYYRQNNKDRDHRNIYHATPLQGGRGPTPGQARRTCIQSSRSIGIRNHFRSWLRRYITLRVPPPPPDIYFIELLRKFRLEDTGSILSCLRLAEKHVSKAGSFEYESTNSKHRRPEFHAYWKWTVLNGHAQEIC